MKRYIFLLVTLFVVVLTTTAQSGGITPDMLREIQNVQPLSPADKAISNAIAANSIDALATPCNWNSPKPISSSGISWRRRT